jgi:O-antigen/teichoic acid export membrane protein
MDISNYTQSALFPVSFVVLWLSFKGGGGVFSMLWAQLFSWAIGSLVQGICCARLRLFPQPGRWGRPTWTRFRELFSFGKDVFLFTLGAQMINASQAILVTRCLGLEAAAVWSVCTKTYLVICQFVFKFFETACTPLAEMLVRGEVSLCAQRFRGVTILTASSAVLMSILFATCNQTFVHLWTGQKIGWSAWNDVLLGIWAVVMSIQRCHVGLLGARKELQVVKYIYFFEGALFVCLALLFTRQGGFPALIAGSIISTLCCSFVYGSYKTMSDFQIGWRELVCDWMAPAGRLASIMIPLAWIVSMAASRLSPIASLIMMASVVGGIGGLLFFRIGLDSSLQKEFSRKMPRKMSEILGLPL